MPKKSLFLCFLFLSSTLLSGCLFQGTNEQSTSVEPTTETPAPEATFSNQTSSASPAPSALPIRTEEEEEDSGLPPVEGDEINEGEEEVQ